MIRRTSLGRSGAARLLGRAESVILFLIAIVLIVLALIVLGSSVIALIQAALEGKVASLAIEILDSVLLVMMTMEIVYTVTVSLEAHRLVAEPFLVIGAIAAIRRILIITAESTALAVSNPDAFRSTLIELGLLAVIVIAMAISVYVLRRSHRFVPASEEQESNEH